MFDKLKDAVSDVLGGNKNDVEKAVENATSSVDEAKATAEKALDDATASGTDGLNLSDTSDQLSGFVNKLKGETGDLSGIASQLGELGGLANVVKDLKFPIDKDQLISKLQDSGGLDKLVEIVKNSTGGKFDSADDVINMVKGFLKK